MNFLFDLYLVFTYITSDKIHFVEEGQLQNSNQLFVPMI